MPGRWYSGACEVVAVKESEYTLVRNLSNCSAAAAILRGSIDSPAIDEAAKILAQERLRLSSLIEIENSE